MTGRSELHPDVVRVMEWLNTSEAAAVSRRMVFSSSLPISAEELRDQALSQVWEMFERNPDRPPLDEPAAYAKRVMHSVCAGRKNREVPTNPEKMARSIIALEREKSPELADRVLHLRSLVEVGSGSVEVKAAVLNVLTLTDPDIDRSDLPRPLRGANADQARWWPALFLATRNLSLFPQEGSSDAAQRQRLSRFMRMCEEVLSVAKLANKKKEFEDG